MPNTKHLSMLPLAIGIFLFLLLVGSGRTARPIYDGVQNQFQLSLVTHSPRAEVGDNYQISVNVENTAAAGRMFVQCSILDEESQPWLESVPRAGIATALEERDNCVPGEPFTQTAVVDLAVGESLQVDFAVTVPDTADKTNVIFCEAYEQCSSDAAGVPQDPLSSSAIKQDISVVTADDDLTNDNVARVPCVYNTDCSSTLLHPVDCFEGFCVDKEDIETPSKVTDIAFREWIAQHKILLTIIAIVLVVIGVFGISVPKLTE